MAQADRSARRRIAVIAGGGSLPLAVTKAILARGDEPVLFPIKGFCEPSTVAGLPHHWVALGQFGRLFSLMRAEGCHTMLPIGSLVRPALHEVRLDFKTLRMMPALISAFRGGDDHLLTRVGRIFEAEGFEVIGVLDVAPELTMPKGVVTQRRPDAVAEEDIAKGRAVLAAIGPFDICQAAVVIDGHVIALEDIEGTDALLARIVRLRDERRIRAPARHGVLVKMPKSGQDLRGDLPALGPRTVTGAEKAQLAGIAVAAGQTLLAEPEEVIARADRAGLFVVGLPA
jgi:DUF1009 family protein